ncbi:purine-nucleoside phosphorylase [Buchnera aphidicola]|uniref:purine-nucleoside phosphorylase n=1 Tax=Buchnera aphidicola TaxID=9 RepID=UPI0034639E94
MVTPHINAKKNTFSERVIMSGDPIRAKYIAENFLENSYQITNIRSMLGFTGYYKGVIVSTMSHGMGIPSACIYITELFKYYHVKKIIRVGTCGTVRNDLDLNDILIALGACTDSSMNRLKFNNFDFSAIADFNMVYDAVNISKKMNLNVNIGNFFTTDSFYIDDYKVYDLLNQYRILGVDMETAGIYSKSAEFGIQSMSICSISDHISKNQFLSYQERESTLNNIIKIALESIIV